ncbi:MAG: M15 family metallopeptidase [Nitrospirota bacterium]
MASRRIDDLHPSVQKRAVLLLDRCAEQGIQVILICTQRDMKEQAALYAQGREEIAKVNALRAVAGMAPLKSITENRIVTNAKPGDSLHNYGLAFDVVPLEAGKPIWDSGHPVWQTIGKIGKECGLEWAGDWKRFKEFPHFQYTGGLSLAQVRQGQRPENA